MPGRIHVGISDAPLDIAHAFAFVADPACGAVASFIGAVRQTNLGRDVIGISYDVHGELAEAVLRGIADKAAAIAPALNVFAMHYRGRLDVGGLAVVIAVATPHRDEAFRACRYIIEEIKHQAPIWKQEHYADGDSEWVQGHALCGH